MPHFDKVRNKGRLANPPSPIQNPSPRQSENVKCKKPKTFQTKC